MEERSLVIAAVNFTDNPVIVGVKPALQVVFCAVVLDVMAAMVSNNSVKNFFIIRF
jgi:hypothetical protein